MDTAEELLSAWLELTVNVRGNRLLNELTLNEIMLLRAVIGAAGPGLTVTQVGERLRLLKSQTHKVTGELESRGFVERKRGRDDGRTVYIAATIAGREIYEREHRHVMEIVESVVEKLGRQDAERLTTLIYNALAAAEEAAGR